MIKIKSGEDNSAAFEDFRKRIVSGNVSEVACSVDGVAGLAHFNEPIPGMMYIAYCGDDIEPPLYEPTRVLYFRPNDSIYAVHPLNAFVEMFANKDYKVS